MSHRFAGGRVTLMVLPLLLHTLLASAVLPTTVLAQPTKQSGLVQTGKQLPSADDRLGLKDGTGDEPRYEAPWPEDEPGELREDGSFTLPPSYAENPDFAKPTKAEKQDYKEEKKESKKGGPVALRLDVSGDITTNTTWTLANSPYVSPAR